MATRAGQDAETLLREGIHSIRAPFIAVLVFSFFINILLFVSPLYMLQIYDRVITSRSEITLWAITAIAMFLLVIYGVLEGLRGRILVRCGSIFNEKLATPVFNAIQKTNVQRPGAANAQSLKDVDTVRDFFAGTGLVTLADLPWFPVFVAGAFLLHPWFGYLAIFGGLVVLALTLLNARTTRQPLLEAAEAGLRANQSAQTTFANTAVLQAMGMLAPLRTRWMSKQANYLGLQVVASDRAGIFLAATKAFRLILQAAILGVGAYLVIHQELSAGSMIAASVLIGRALQPVEQAVGNWKSITSARAAWDRLSRLLLSAPAVRNEVSLPRPSGELTAENLVVAVAATGRILIRGISFVMQPGELVALIGPSGSGKSTLGRALVGAAALHSGKVRLDGHDINHWPEGELGRHVGYLPQDVELFPGTVAENISRFSEGADADVLAAAELAGCSELVQSLPDGYNTQIGEGGHMLSGGQRQRIGLARALYGNPSLIVLDEPDANLDEDGTGALQGTLRQLKGRKVTAVLISHRPVVRDLADRIMRLDKGALAPATGSIPAIGKTGTVRGGMFAGRSGAFGGVPMSGRPTHLANPSVPTHAGDDASPGSPRRVDQRDAQAKANA